MERIDPEAFEALTFDCYGTLIDWDTGIAKAVRSLPELAGCDQDRLLADRERDEADIEAGEFQVYGEVLARSVQRAAARQGREVADASARAFAETMVSWPPFSDSHAALSRLRRRYRLAIVSNVETHVLERSIELLGVPFDVTVTAEEVRSYKPARRHFDEVLRRLDLPPPKVLHVAGSLFHDIAPVLELGWNAVWIDRRAHVDTGGLEPLGVLSDMRSLAEALRAR